MNFREELNKLDHKSLDEGLKFYDLRTMYEAVDPKLTAQDKSELKQLLNSTNDPNMVVTFLQTKAAEKNEEFNTEYVGENVGKATEVLQNAIEEVYPDAYVRVEEIDGIVYADAYSNDDTIFEAEGDASLLDRIINKEFYWDNNNHLKMVEKETESLCENEDSNVQDVNESYEPAPYYVKLFPSNEVFNFDTEDEAVKYASESVCNDECEEAGVYISETDECIYLYDQEWKANTCNESLNEEVEAVIPAPFDKYYEVYDEATDAEIDENEWFHKGDEIPGYDCHFICDLAVKDGMEDNVDVDYAILTDCPEHPVCYVVGEKLFDVEVKEDESLTEAFDKYDVIDWLADHETAYNDALNHFDVEELEEINVEDIMDWIREHDQLSDDFDSFFNKSNLDESWVEEWWGQTEESPEDFADKYGLQIKKLDVNGDETLYRFTGSKEAIQSAMDDGYFYSVDYDEKTVTSDDLLLTDEEKEIVDEVADRYSTSQPVSGNWDTEATHERDAIMKALNCDEYKANRIMIDYLGFDAWDLEESCNEELDNPMVDWREEEDNERFPSHRYEKIKSKSVTDYDGFNTDYTMYYDTEDNKYVFIFGDNDIYDADNSEPDWECETKDEAEEWFDSYNGIEEDN